MTVGQRIMQKRKELGLSQEALGEKLNVSRQAIYKWESDAALPEIEKLVALSKMFSVTVGELLGVEGPAEDGSRELTSGQIKVVEEIVSRYRDSIPNAKEPKKHRRLFAAAAVLIAAAMTVSLFTLKGRIRNLDGNYQNLQNSVGDIDRRVGLKINSITEKVEDVLRRVNSFTTEHGAKIDSIDFKGGTVTFSVYAVPKTYTEGMAACFRALSDSSVKEIEGVFDEGKRGFLAKLTMPLNDDKIDVSVVFTAGGRQDIQPIDSFDSLYHCSFPVGYMHTAPPLDFIMEDNILRPEHCLICLDKPQEEHDVPKSEFDKEKTRLGLFADGVLVRWMERAEETDESVELRRGSDYTMSFRNTDPVELDLDKSYCLAAVIADNYGRELVLPDDHCPPVIYYKGDKAEDGYWGWPEGDVSGLIPKKWVY